MTIPFSSSGTSSTNVDVSNLVTQDQLVNFSAYTGSTNFTSMLTIAANNTSTTMSRLFDADDTNNFAIQSDPTARIAPNDNVDAVFTLPVPITGVTLLEVHADLCEFVSINDGPFVALATSSLLPGNTNLTIYNSTTPISLSKIHMRVEQEAIGDTPVFFFWYSVKVNGVRLIDGVNPSSDRRLADRTKIYDKIVPLFQPAYASYQLTSHIALANSTFTTLTNFTPQITSFNMTLANNNRFTVTNAGVYKMDCFFMSNVVPGTLEFFVLQLCDQDNIVLSEVKSLDQLKDSDQQHTLNISNLRHLDAGDFVYINAKIGATPPPAATSRDVLGFQYSNVNIHRVA